MVHAMADLGSELRRLLAARGMSLNELARQAPCDPGYLSKVVRGQKRASPRLLARLDEILGADGAITALAGSPPTAAGDLDLIELARRAEVSDVGPATLGLLETATDGLCRDYSGADPAQLAARARQHLRYVTKLIGGRVTLTQHRELLVIAGWLSAVLACASYDMSDTASARIARTMTAQFAAQAGHGELAAWSTEIGSWFALVEGRYGETAALAEAGLEHAGVTSAGVQLALQAARGYARMGDTRARDALRAGRTILERLPVPSHPEHHFVFDGGKFEFYVATILTWLGGEDDVAAEHAREVVAQCTAGGAARWPMRLAMSQIDLAFIAARRGDLDEAAALGSEALTHSRRSAQLLPRAFELGDDLATRYPGEQLVVEYARELPTAQPSHEPARQAVTYVVRGSSADVTYGPEGSNFSGSVPMRVTKHLGHPQYYAISAQLNGAGSVTCKILVDGKVISKATATGGYNIADCEISPDPFSGKWEDTNSQ